MKSAKQAAAAAKDSGGRTAREQTIHRRLRSALGLGIRFYDGEGWKWKSTDFVIQRHVLRSISSFLDSVTPDMSRNDLVKDSIADIVRALVWILQYKSEAALSTAASLVVKLMNTIPNAILKPYILDLIRPLSALLFGYSVQVSTSCASALTMILYGLNVKGDHKVWEMLTESNSVHLIVSNMSVISGSDAETTENFLEMISLLSIIMYWCPPSRYGVWSNVKFMDVLGIRSLGPDFSVKIAVLKLYVGIALCSHGANMLVQDGQVLRLMVSCMGKSYPSSIRVVGFRLAKCLATNEGGCLKMMSLFCEPIVKAIIDGMSGWSFRSRKMDDDQMSLLVEACQLARIVRWKGEHHKYFWMHGIDCVLVHLLSENFRDLSSQGSLSLEKLMPMAQEALNLDFLMTVRPYIWDILGGLAVHYMEGINHDLPSNEVQVTILIICACLSFLESIEKGRRMLLNDVAGVSRGGAAARAVLMMICSPGKYFELKAKLIISEILKPTGKDHLKHILRYISFTSSRNTFATPDLLAVGINLMALTCYSNLPLYRSHIVETGGLTILVAFLSWCLRHKVHVKGLGLAQLNDDKSCCWQHKEEWEGDEMLLMCGLWGLAELLLSGCVANPDIFEYMDHPEDQFVNTLQDICMSSSAPGLRWFSAYMLSCFCIYGFPSRLGQRIGKALHENEHANMQVILRSRQNTWVHGVILAIRCPSLLPPQTTPPSEKPLDDKYARKDQLKQHVDLCYEVYLSSHVGSEELAKLLEYVYLGRTCAGEELLKKLKILAKHCGLEHLLIALRRNRPNWGSPFPCYDLSPALTAAGEMFSDIILEAKESQSISWECRACSASVSHVHAHKVVLGSSCDYLRAMFQSGMQESLSKTVKVPVSWEAMIKLVHWFYTDELPNPPIGCPWLNMGAEEKLQALHPYLELYWLSDFWFLETVQDICYQVIVSRMDSNASLSVKLLNVSADLSLWKLAEVAADRLAPVYRQLCQSGDLESLDEGLIDMIRAASVRISRDGVETV